MHIATHHVLGSLPIVRVAVFRASNCRRYALGLTKDSNSERRVRARLSYYTSRLEVNVTVLLKR